MSEGINMVEERKIKLFTDSDLDGISCGILASITFADDVTVEYCTPKNINDKLKTCVASKDYDNYTKIFITDLSISEDAAQVIDTVNANFKFRLFDHHKSSKVLTKFKWCKVAEFYGSTKTCGTELFWDHLKEYFIPGIYNFKESAAHIDNYVEYVRLWDTWDWTLDETKGLISKKLNTLVDLYSMTKYINTTIKKLSVENTPFISDTEELIIHVFENKKSRYILNKLKNVRRIKYLNYSVGVVFAEEYISELGNYIAKKCEDIDFVALINSDLHVVSLRTVKNDVDLSIIAKKFGGGGHPKSSGFVFDMNIENDLVKNIFKL